MAGKDKAVTGKEITVRAPDAAAGQRLDAVLAEAIEGMSRSRLKSLIVDGRSNLHAPWPRVSTFSGALRKLRPVARNGGVRTSRSGSARWVSCSWELGLQGFSS